MPTSSQAKIIIAIERARGASSRQQSTDISVNESAELGEGITTPENMDENGITFSLCTGIGTGIPIVSDRTVRPISRQTPHLFSRLSLDDKTSPNSSIACDLLSCQWRDNKTVHGKDVLLGWNTNSATARDQRIITRRHLQLFPIHDSPRIDESEIYHTTRPHQQQCGCLTEHCSNLTGDGDTRSVINTEPYVVTINEIEAHTEIEEPKLSELRPLHPRDDHDGALRPVWKSCAGKVQQPQLESVIGEKDTQQVNSVFKIAAQLMRGMSSRTPEVTGAEMLPKEFTEEVLPLVRTQLNSLGFRGIPGDTPDKSKAFLKRPGVTEKKKKAVKVITNENAESTYLPDILRTEMVLDYGCLDQALRRPTAVCFDIRGTWLNHANVYTALNDILVLCDVNTVKIKCIQFFFRQLQKGSNGDNRWLITTDSENSRNVLSGRLLLFHYDPEADEVSAPSASCQQKPCLLRRYDDVLLWEHRQRLRKEAWRGVFMVKNTDITQLTPRRRPRKYHR